MPYDEHITPGKSTAGNEDDTVVIDAVAESKVREIKEQPLEKQDRAFAASETDEVEIPSVPRGFFYKFQYPVTIIQETPSRRQSRQLEKESTVKVRRTADSPLAAAVAVKTSEKTTAVAPPTVVGIQLKSTPTVDSTKTLQQSRVSLKSVEDGAIPVDAVHDAQVHPKQRGALVNSQALPVAIQHE